MATFKGVNGFLALGGYLQGVANVLVNGSKAQGQTVISLDAVTTLQGVVHTGDQFTIAGETGAPVHTVTGGPWLAAANAIANMSFTTAIATGGVADNAVVTMLSNAIVQASLWNVTSTANIFDVSAFQNGGWKQQAVGMVGWTADGECWLDENDARQMEVITAMSGANPNAVLSGTVFGISGLTSAVREFYGAALLTNMAWNVPASGLVKMTFQMTGSGALAIL